MGVNTVPRFIETPQTYKGQVSVANTNISGNTGTLATIVTGADHGSKIDYFTFKAQGATQTNRLRLYLFTGGATAHLWTEIAISATSAHKVDGTTWNGSLTPVAPLVIPSGWTLRCSIHSANVVNIFAQGGDY